MTKAGYVGLVGKPNAGKSTLLNAILGQKLSATSPKPQTTRKRIFGILTEEEYQLIIMDTPGIIKPKYLLQHKMMEYVNESVEDVDVLVYLFDASIPESISKFDEDPLYERIKNLRHVKIGLINKSDLMSEEKIAEFVKEVEGFGIFNHILNVSAMKSTHIAELIELILKYIPEHPKYYPEDSVSNESERFFVTELIRETILKQYKDEIPYSCEVVIEDFKEVSGRKDHISAMIYVERDSQKGIIIGKGGEAIKELGKVSREAIEAFLERPVFLELRVKVRDNWRSDERMLKYFGYGLDKDED